MVLAQYGEKRQDYLYLLNKYAFVKYITYIVTLKSKLNFSGRKNYLTELKIKYVKFQKNFKNQKIFNERQKIMSGKGA